MEYLELVFKTFTCDFVTSKFIFKISPQFLRNVNSRRHITDFHDVKCFFYLEGNLDISTLNEDQSVLR